MRPVAHLLAAAGLGAVVYGGTGDVLLTAAVMVGEGGLDVDHGVEYWLRLGKQATLADFLRPGSIAQWPRLIFALHGYEWVVLLVVMGGYWENIGILGVAVGGLVHLLMDEIGNRMPGNRHRIHPLFYFFTYRLSRGFRRDKISTFR